MDPDLLKAIENATCFTLSPGYQLALKAATSPALLDAQRLGAKVQKLAANPDILAVHNASMAASKGLNIAQLNSALSQFIQIPAENFKAFKQVAVQNSSELRDIVKANYETISNMVEQDSEDDADKELVVPETVAELITDIDGSIEFPKSGPKQKIRVNKSDFNTYIGIISLVITLSTLFFSIYQSWASTELSEQQHTELMREKRKQTGYLKQIAENTASTNSADQPSEDPPKNKIQ